MRCATLAPSHPSIDLTPHIAITEFLLSQLMYPSSYKIGLRISHVPFCGTMVGWKFGLGPVGGMLSEFENFL